MLFVYKLKLELAMTPHFLLHLRHLFLINFN